MAQPSLAFLEVGKIDIEKDFNVRTDMDEAALERFAGQVSETGVTQSIQVRPTDGDRFALVAGHRRLIAARKGGVATIPALIREMTRAEAILFQLIENLHREELNDVDLAHGIGVLAEEWGLRTNQEIADKVRLGVDRVALLRRVAKLPVGVQKYIGAGVVPTRAEKQLREVAATSPRVAECVCEFAARKKIDHTDFIRDFAEILRTTAEAPFADAPPMIRTNRIELKKVIADKDKRRELVDRFNAAVPWQQLASEDPVIAFKDPEVDAARAAGCLVEHIDDHGQFTKTVRLVTDAELATDLIERRIEAMEAEAAERQKDDSGGEEDAESKAALSDQRKAEHRKREKDKTTAEGFNEELLAGLTNRNAAARRKHGLARKKAIARILIANNPDLAGAGLRFVRPALKDIEVKTLKSGEPRKKVSYASPPQSTDWLWGRIDSARSEGEVDDLLIEAIICALLADRKAVARTHRFGWHCLVAGEVEELLAFEIAEVSPASASKGKKRSGGAKKKAVK